ncbi:MAG: DUF3489 domain-containing protein [Pseudolabrys sp.]
MNYSQHFTVKSNARRAARKAGLDPNTVERHAGGFRFPIADAGSPKATKPKTAKAKHEDGKAKARKSTTSPRKAGLVEKVHGMITAKGGATMPEICRATGWLEHTARARISGIAKKHKLKIARSRENGITTYAVE